MFFVPVLFFLQEKPLAQHGAEAPRPEDLNFRPLGTGILLVTVLIVPRPKTPSGATLENGGCATYRACGAQPMDFGLWCEEQPTMHRKQCKAKAKFSSSLFAGSLVQVTRKFMLTD